MAQNIVAHEDTTGYAPADSRWCAYDDSTYDGPGCPLGKGATEDEAIADLEQQLDDADEAAELAADMACDACKGTGFVTISTRTYAYICAGEPPEDARHVAAAICCECHSHHRHGYSYDRQGSRR
jgi:hypothetical protein